VAYLAGQRASTPTSCPHCGVTFLPNPSRTQRYCTALCGRHARQHAERARRPAPAPAHCAHCGLTFIPPLRHPYTRHCSPRCASRARSHAVKVIAHGFARRGPKSADGRERSLRCCCGRALGYVMDARIVVLDGGGRVVVQRIATGQLRLAAECVACQELRQVLAVPAVGPRPASVAAVQSA